MRSSLCECAWIVMFGAARSASTYSPGLLGSPLRTTVSIPLTPDVPAPPAEADGQGISSSLTVAGPLSRACAPVLAAAAATSVAAITPYRTRGEKVVMDKLSLWSTQCSHSRYNFVFF